MRPKKVLAKILAGSRNIRFSDLTGLAEAYGFQLARIKGSHHIYSHPVIAQNLNLQDVKGQAKMYQVRQLLKLVESYNLKLEGDA